MSNSLPTTSRFTLPEAERFARLALDLRHLALEGAPPEEALWHAPIVDGWTETLVPQRAIIGRPAGSGTCVATHLFAIGPDRFWARTAAGWMRLRRHVDEMHLKSL